MMLSNGKVAPMPNKKPTDSEIVKALEEHYKQVDKEYRTHLEYGGKGDEFAEKYIYMLCDVLDLINRLKAENEKLTIRLRKERYQFADIGKMYSEIKSEAYKEFAERLHAKLRMYGVKDKFNKVVFLNAVDKAKKELEVT